MTPYIIGICGGSGSGKSTLSFALEDYSPDKVTIFHVDDYFKPEDEVPLLKGMRNWDDPRAIDSEKMVRDLTSLKSGKTVTINTKSPRLNPGFLKTGKRIPIDFKPKPLIIVEGFLALYFEELRKLFDATIYLEAHFELHTSRRIHGKLHNFPENYNELVLKPMHERYVYPFKKNSDLIINVESLTPVEVAVAVRKFIEPKLVFLR